MVVGDGGGGGGFGRGGLGPGGGGGGMMRGRGFHHGGGGGGGYGGGRHHHPRHGGGEGGPHAHNEAGIPGGRGGVPPGLPMAGMSAEDFDGKRLRKSMMRKTVDYNSSYMLMLERRIWQRDWRDRRALQPDVTYYPELLPPSATLENPANAVTTRFVKTATNKMRCPVFTLAWTPEGRRLITGASSGEFTLWNGLTFNFETILQAHDSPVRAMVWSHNDQWMVTGDHGGYIKYWQSNMNQVKMFQAHKEPVRSVSFSPTDNKFASCSDDGTVRVWDFLSCTEERVLRGHGSDVKCVDWHPTKGLLASGSKDNQQPVKIWEPKTGAVLCTLHAHKSTVMDIEWNKNGNWLLTASRDHLLKLFDIRNTKEEIQTFRGHKKEASTLAWHPVHEGVFASGGSDGAIMFWNVGADKEVGVVEAAHESIVWSLAWHPIGHILCSGSNDHTCKFWTRNRPGDTMRDKYNLNTLPHGPEDESATSRADASRSAPAVVIPGMAPEDRIDPPPGPPPPAMPNTPGTGANNTPLAAKGAVGIFGSSGDSPFSLSIPGLEDDGQDKTAEKKKTPYAKPIPKNFQASWNAIGNPAAGGDGPGGGFEQQQQQHMMGGPGGPFGGPPPMGAPPPFGGGGPPPMNMDPNCISLQELQRQATAVVAFGNVYPVLPGSNLFMSIPGGERAVKDVIRAEFL